MKDRSWGCSVTRTCLKNTVIDPVGVQERSQDVSVASSKGTTRQAEAIPTPTIDQLETSKEGVDALNTLMLRKLAKESFLSGVPRKAGDSGESHCHKKASTWETLREARNTAVSCKCGSHLGKEFISTFPNHHSNTMHTDTTKNNSASFDGGKVTEGVGSLLSRIGLDNRRKPEPELPVSQHSSRFDKVPQHRTFVSTQDFLKSIPSKDAGEFQGAGTHNSSRECLSNSAEQVTSNCRTNVVNIFAEKNTSYCCAMEKHSVGLSGAALREGTVKERSKHVSWAKEISVSKDSAGRSYNEENDQELFCEAGMTGSVHTRILGQKVDANEMITNPQASNFKSSMHTVGHMWCIPEANSVADAMCTESSPSHRCSATGHEEATASRRNPECPLSTHDDFDELAPLENCLLKPHLNSPVQKEATIEEVVNQSSLPNATTKDMELQINEARDLYSSRSRQHPDSPLVGRELIRKIFRDEGEEETVSSKISWPLGLKAAANVRWNLRELMQREEIEEDVDANLNALRTACMPKQGKEELGCRVEELARSMVEKQNDAKQDDSVGGRGTPQRLELGVTKLKHQVPQRDDASRGTTKTDPNATPRSQLMESERTVQGVKHVREEKIARRASLQHNHVHSSCPDRDNGRNGDTHEVDDELFRGKAPSPDTKKLVKLRDFRGDSAAVRDLEVDCGTGRDDLEVLLEFLTMKQQLRENKQTNVEVVVQTEAIVRELLSRMKLDSEYSSSVDSDASVCFLPKFHLGKPVVDDGYCEGGRNRREQSTSVLSTVSTNDATERDVLEPDSVNSQSVSVHPNQKIDCQSRSAIRRPPFGVASSSKPQRMTGSSSTGTRKPTSCSRHCCDLSQESKVATSSPSRNPEEARKRSRRSTGSGARQVESRRNIQSVKPNLPVQKHVIDVATPGEEVVSVGSQSNVVKGGSSTGTGMETVDQTSGCTQPLESADNDGVTLPSALTSSQTEAPHGSLAMPPYSARNSESRTFAGSSPARTPLNHQREQQLQNFPFLSPVRRTTPKSPSSPHRRSFCDSPTRRYSPNNRLSALASPQRQQKPRPATATLASQLGSPLKPTKRTLSKDLAGDMSAYTLVSKPSQDVDNVIFPAGISEAVVQQSIALAKDSSDPYADFRDSMLEMMQEKNLWQREEELQDLLQCFLHLNQPVHHQLIHQAFSDVVSFGSPMRYHHKSSRKERSKAHVSRHRSSPSRSPSRQLWDISQPARGGG